MFIKDNERCYSFLLSHNRLLGDLVWKGEWRMREQRNIWKICFLASLLLATGFGIYSFVQHETILFKNYIPLVLSCIFFFWALSEWKDKEKQMAYVYFIISSLNLIYFSMEIIL
jgi:TctA family transporter